MWTRVSAWGGRSRLLCLPQGAQEWAAAAERHQQPGSGGKTHKCFSTSTGLYKEDESATSTQNNVEKDSEKATEENSKQNLLKVISEMKVELSSKKKFQLLKALKTKDQPESMASASSMFQKATADSKAKSRKLLNPELVEAASAVASSLPFDRKQTVSDLLALLRKHEEATDAQKRGEVTNISNIISNMKIGKRRLIRDVPGPSSQISFDDDEQDDRFQRGSLSGLARSQTRRGIHLKSRLNIFPDAPTATQRTPESESSPSLWDLELANEIAAVNHKPPRNGFEEMIQWTKEGKLWEFPINNEAGIEDDVEFHEHIFLDKYLEDFPKQGPIRHFMELVTCGLSKNPYLSVKEKAEHIEWFRNYFQEKEELLRELIDHKKETDLNLEMRNLSK